MRQELTAPNRSACNPAGRRECSAKLLEGADQREVDGVSGKAIGGGRVLRQPLAVKNFEAHANGVRKDDICRYSICRANGQGPRQFLICKIEKDKGDQPNG